MHLVQTNKVKRGTNDYRGLDEMSHKANNIFNALTYYCRQNLFENGAYTSYAEMDRVFKERQKNGDTNLYKVLGTHIFQQIAKKVEKNFKSFFEANKDWKKDNGKYTGRPRLPRYHDKGSASFFTIDNQTFKFEDNTIKWKKPRKDSAEWTRYNLSEIKLDDRIKVNKVQEIQITPGPYYYTIHIVYEVDDTEFIKDNGRYMSIDPGMNNFATIAFNFDKRPIIINGRPLKAINQLANKKIAKAKSLLATNNSKLTSKRIDKLWATRHEKIEQYMNEASKSIVETALSHSVSKIVIGNGIGSKRNSNLSKRTNQNFVQIPHGRFINLLTYKASLVGIEVIHTDECYTSQTSFLDDEQPIASNGNKAREKRGIIKYDRRIRRGMFRTDSGTLINADVNGALQIMKKVFPNVISDGIEGVVLRPVKVSGKIQSLIKL